MSSFTLPVSGYQVTLRESLTHKVARKLANFETDHMKWVESTKEVFVDGKTIQEPVREVVYAGSLMSQKQDFMVLSFIERLEGKDGQYLAINQDAIDGLDYKDGEFLYQKVEEAYRLLKKKQRTGE